MNKLHKTFHISLLALLTTFSFFVKAQDNKSIEKQADKNKGSLMIPTAFTPNGDGVNDYFKIANLKDENIIDFRVFNRWGTIYYLDRGDNKGWDGTFKGRFAETGAYGYLIKIQFKDGSEETFRGTVLLLR